MPEAETRDAAGTYPPLEAGQVAEIRLCGAAASYWTYVRSASGARVQVWLPEVNGEPVALESGARVELTVTLERRGTLLARGEVKSLGEDGRPYAELELDPGGASVESRRRYLRVAAVVPVSVRRMPDGLTPWGEPVEGRTASLSPGGLSFEAAGTFARGEQLALALSLPGCRADAAAAVLDCSPAEGGRSRVSVRFTYISDLAEAAVTRVIYQYQRIHGAAAF